MDSGIAKRVSRHSTQEVCPWNVRFSRELAEDSPFKPREFLGAKDARQLARDLLVMSQEEFSAAFRKSPMKRAKLRGREHAARALTWLRHRGGSGLPAVPDAEDPA